MRIMRKGLFCILISKMIFCSCLTFLPVGRRDLTGLCLSDGPAAEGLELAAHQRPPEEGPAGEAGGGGVEAVAELQTTQHDHNLRLLQLGGTVRNQGFLLGKFWKIVVN